MAARRRRGGGAAAAVAAKNFKKFAIKIFSSIFFSM
jgi:hypothetical protein